MQAVTRYFGVLLLLLLCSLAVAAQQKQEILLLTYHLKAPYIVDLAEHRGLYFDLANYLNKRSENYWFKTEFMPRKRIDALLQRPFPHVVIGVQPEWFKHLGDRVSYTAPILQENDVFVSLKTRSLSKKNITALSGNTFIGVQGYIYVALEQAEKDGRLARVDTLHEDNVLDMLQLGRGDFTIISQSTLRYKFSHGEDAKLYFVASAPHEQIKRRLMYSSSDPQLGAELNALVAQMQTDPAWLAILNKYKLDKSFLPQN
jgi:polar amino acid transport system substrate-binding protein